MSGQVTTKPTAMQPSVLQTLVAKLSRPVSVSTQHRAAVHVLDWLGSAKLGVHENNAQGFAHVTAMGSSGQCQTVNGARHDWWHALQLNAAVGNLLEMDDLHRASILHPGPVIIPAAIAVAELIEAPGEKLLVAIVRGYEATIRIGRALGASHYAYFHNTSSAGAFGAAAAAADLLGLTAQQTVWALANAGSRTGGLWQMRHEECETKSLHNVMAAQTGVQAALLAQQNIRGPLSLLEGPQGLFAAMAAGSNPQDVLNHIDDDWLIHEVSFKPWPACRHAHPTIDASLMVLDKLRANSGFSGISSIESITVNSYQSAIDFCDKPCPATTLQAKFSLQHCVAAVLSDGEPWLAQFESDYFSRPDIAALREKINVHVSPTLTARFPAHYSAEVCVTLNDGRVFSHQQDDALGDPEFPMSHALIAAKATRLLLEAGVKDVDGLIATTRELANITSTKKFTDKW